MDRRTGFFSYAPASLAVAAGIRGKT